MFCHKDNKPITRLTCSQCEHNKDVRFPLGNIKFVSTKNGVVKYATPYVNEYADLSIIQSREPIGDIIPGDVFYKLVEDFSLINDDGKLAYVWLDGYSTNLGLHHNGFSQGRFLVDGATWLELCKKHKIEVEWCNN